MAGRRASATPDRAPAPPKPAAPKRVWQKSAPALIALFDRLLPAISPVERRKMFGYPAAFRGGVLFAGLHEQNFVLRLAEADRAAIIAGEAATPWSPMPGRPMREYVALPAALLADPDRLALWIARASAHAATLTPRKKKT